MHEAVFVDDSRVARVEPAAVEALKVAFVEALVVIPERCEACGSEWRTKDDVAHFSRGY